MGLKKIPKNVKKTATFNGKRYHRGSLYYPTKKQAQEAADNRRKKNMNVILEERIKGYILWIKNK